MLPPPGNTPLSAADTEPVRKALAAALRVREQSLERVRGEAALEHFLTDKFLALMPQALVTPRKAAGLPMDRQMEAVRFAVDGPRHRFEDQMLLWGGSNIGWLGGDDEDVLRPANKVSDLYYQEFLRRGGHLHGHTTKGMSQRWCMSHVGQFEQA